MARFKGGAGGALSGMLGEIVVVTHKSGKVYLRTAPRKHQFSDKQKQNWKRFSAVTAFWKKFDRSPVQQIWKVAQEGRRGINLFINANAPAFNTEGEMIEPERLHFSSGQLPLPHKVNGNYEEDKLTVRWETDNSNNLSRSDDELMLMLLKNGDFTGPVPTGVTRKKGLAVIELEDGLEGVYLFFGSEKRKLYSEDLFFKRP